MSYFGFSSCWVFFLIINQSSSQRQEYKKEASTQSHSFHVPQCWGKYMWRYVVNYAGELNRNEKSGLSATLQPSHKDLPCSTSTRLLEPVLQLKELLGKLQHNPHQGPRKHTTYQTLSTLLLATRDSKMQIKGHTKQNMTVFV